MLARRPRPLQNAAGPTRGPGADVTAIALAGLAGLLTGLEPGTLSTVGLTLIARPSANSIRGG